MFTRRISFGKLALMSFSLCAPMSSFAQTGGAEDGWQDVESFLNQSEQPAAPNALSAPYEPDNYDPQALGPGDIITVNIKKVPDFSRNYTVDENGKVDFPLIGLVKVQGATPDDFAEELAVLYEKDYLVNPAITVSIFAKRLPLDRPATPLYGPASLAINNEPLAFGTEADLSVEPQTILEALTVLPEASPQILPEVLPDIVPDTAPDIVIDTGPEDVWETVPELTVEVAPVIVPDITPDPDIDLAAIIAPSPAPQIDISEALPLDLAASHWAIEGSSEDFIHFLADGDMAGALSCNSFFARYDAGQSDLNISAVTSTNIPCADQSKPQEFIDNLKQTQSYLLSDNTLLLLDDLGQLIFALQPK